MFFLYYNLKFFQIRQKEFIDWKKLRRWYKILEKVWIEIIRIDYLG